MEAPARSPYLVSAVLAATVLLGGQAGAQAPLHTLESPLPAIDFGSAVSAVPDVDGDGRMDLVIGAPGERVGGGAHAGRVHVFSGATGVRLGTLVSPNWHREARFGSGVAGVEDLDGDGRGEVLVGAPNEEPSFEGRAYVFNGATGAVLHTLSSPNAPESEPDGAFGAAVARVPDADGDGRDDLLVGAPHEDGGASSAGRAYLFSGATGALLLTLETPNPVAFTCFGCSVSGVPDADGDGRGDLLVGNFDAGAGSAYAFSGATGGLLHALVSPHPQHQGHFGESVSGIEDVDEDGRGDLLVGAPWEDPGTSPPRAGRAYVFSGASGALIHELASPAEAHTGFFGVAVAGVADLDGDGRGDLLVGAERENAVAAGNAHLFSGATGDPLRSFSSPRPEAFGFFGSAVAGAGDADGDGWGDLLIGAEHEPGGNGASDAGRAHVFSGAACALSLDAASITPTTFAPDDLVMVAATVGNAAPTPVEARLELHYRRAGSGPAGAVVLGEGTVPPTGASVSRTWRVRPNTQAGVYDIFFRLFQAETGTFCDAGSFPVTVVAPHTEGVAGDAALFEEASRGAEFSVAAAPSPPSVVIAGGAVVLPNPTLDRVSIAFPLADPAAVRVALYDVLGRAVASVEAGYLPAGVHRLGLDLSALPSGVYVWRLVAGDRVESGRLTVAR